MRRRKGNIALIVGLSLTVLLGFGAITLDLGYRRVVEQELQNASDAAALAGAAVLVDEGPDAARALAIEIAGMNHAGGRAVLLAPEDVEIGSWDAAANTWVSDEDGGMVRVVATRDDVPRALGAVLGWANPPAARGSVAVAPGGSGSCAFFSVEDLSVRGTPLVHAGVCSNDDVGVSGNPDIEGDALSGPGDDVNLNGVPEIGGRVGALPDEIAIDYPSTSEPWRNSSLSCPSGVTCQSTTADLSITGPRTLNLSAGSYKWRDIRTSGQAKINVTSGPVYIFATGDCDMAGQGVLNTTADPANLVMYCQGDVNLSGNAGWYGTLYAGGDIAISGGGSGWEFHGTAMAGGAMDISGNVELFASGELLSGGATTGRPRLVR